MDTRLLQSAVNPLIDLDALQAYLRLYLLNLRSLSSVSLASFGAVLGQQSGFHLRIGIADSDLSDVLEMEHADPRITSVIDAAVPTEEADAAHAINLSLIRIESPAADGQQLALISLAAQPSTGLHSYQMFEVPNQAALTQLLSDPAIRDVHSVSHLLLRQHLGFRTRQSGVPRKSATGASPTLTERQREIVRLVAVGLSDKQIALRLGLSQHTVHNVLRRLMSRYSLHRRIQLCRLMEATQPLQSMALC